ncbi:MAG: thiol peroxidase [Acidimicrobiales bacterium]|nr:thiol peroxidase [Acidimicrobiales bacterium]
MASVTLGGKPVNTNGDIPAVGSAAPDFTLVGTDLAPVSLADHAGKKVVLSIFPSLDTATCANAVRTFNSRAAGLENTVVLNISADLPFAQKRFCGAEGIENVSTASSFRSPDFPASYGLQMVDGPLEGLCARAVVVVGEDGNVKYTELVPEISTEPNYDAALAAL